MLSKTEENYLKALYHLSAEGLQKVPTNSLAMELNINAASVTDKLKRLQEKGWVDYKKSRGALLTSLGKEKALDVVRRHRLWELFLTEVLNFEWSEVHDLAEQLEHIQSDILIEKIDKYLDYPKFDPHGDPIPDATGKIEKVDLISLNKLKPGKVARLARVTMQTPEFMDFCNSHNLVLENEIKLLSREKFDGSMQIEVHGREMTISEKAGSHLFVEIL